MILRGYAIACLAVLPLLWLGLILELEAGWVVSSLCVRVYLFLAAVTMLIVICLMWLVPRNLIRIYLLLCLTPPAILPFVDISPRKPYTRFYRSIQLGMSYNEVNDLLVKHFPENGPYNRPVGGYDGGARMDYILDPNDGWYNAELIVLKMNDGQVCSKQYLHD